MTPNPDPTDQHFHESNLIEGFDSAEADKCLERAWDYLSEQNELNHGVVRKVQKLATVHQDDLRPDERGYYRRVPVYVGGREGASSILIHPLMDDWLNDLEKVDPKTAHIRFEKIHPFIDGNGRTGRLLMWWHEIKLGQEPTLIRNSEKGKYYEWFK